MNLTISHPPETLLQIYLPSQILPPLPPQPILPTLAQEDLGVPTKPPIALNLPCPPPLLPLDHMELPHQKKPSHLPLVMQKELHHRAEILFTPSQT